MEIVPTNELNCVQSFCRLMNCLAIKANGVDQDSTDTSDLEHMGKLWFVFCLVWSICATVDEPGRLKIDNFVREMESLFPLKDTVYDYYVDVKHRSLQAWDEQLNDDWRFNPE